MYLVCQVLVDEEPAPWTFEVVEDATKRGKPRLLDSRGYSYTQAKGTANGTFMVFSAVIVRVLSFFLRVQDNNIHTKSGYDSIKLSFK